MNDFYKYKEDALSRIKAHAESCIDPIKKKSSDHRLRAKLINMEVGKTCTDLRQELQLIQDVKERQGKLLTLEYCASVASLEYRHAMWKYEYMAFSRRIGELWERLCKSCWEIPTRADVKRVAAPDFALVLSRIRVGLEAKLKDLPQQQAEALRFDVETLFSLVGDISMEEDEVFTVGDTLHVVDFKSGFGSNEKGNMLRLMAVARAYRHYDPKAQLFLIVRQAENNNYLEILRKSKLWQVECHDNAYKKIGELTGTPIAEIKEQIIDFKKDLSESFLKDLSGELSDLTSYLEW
jgi:hypothetical protein